MNLPTNTPIPDGAILRHGDMLFPRRMDVEAISGYAYTHSDEVSDLMEDARSAIDGTLPPWQRPSTIAQFDLVKYWPYLMDHLRRLRELNPEFGFSELLRTIWKELPPGGLNAADLAQAIIAKRYVGHCALLDLSNPEEPWVIEASHDTGCVHTIPYKTWLAQRLKNPDIGIWVRRLKALAADKDNDDASQAMRNKLIDMAHRLRMRRVRYAIFDGIDGAKLTLDTDKVRPVGDPPYLYCSEFIHVCVRDALDGINLYESANNGSSPHPPRRFQMYTPKDLSGSALLMHVNNPGGKIYREDPETS